MKCVGGRVANWCLDTHFPAFVPAAVALTLQSQPNIAYKLQAVVESKGPIFWKTESIRPVNWIKPIQVANWNALDYTDDSARASFHVLSVFVLILDLYYLVIRLCVIAAVCEMLLYRIFSDSRACCSKFCQVSEVTKPVLILHSCYFVLTTTGSLLWPAVVSTTAVLLLFIGCRL